MKDIVECKVAVRQGCSWSFCVFDIFKGDVLNCGREGNTHGPTKGSVSVPCSLFTDT